MGYEDEYEPDEVPEITEPTLVEGPQNISGGTGGELSLYWPHRRPQKIHAPKKLTTPRPTPSPLSQRTPRQTQKTTAMITCEMKPEDKKKFISDVGQCLVRQHGKKKYYKPKQIHLA